MCPASATAASRRERIAPTRRLPACLLYAARQLSPPGPWTRLRSRMSWHQSNTRDNCRRSVAGPQGPVDRQMARLGVAGNLVVQRIREAGLRHRRLPRHQQLKLIPAQRLPLTLAPQQLEPSRNQEDARVRPVDAQSFPPRPATGRARDTQGQRDRTYPSRGSSTLIVS